MFLYSVRDNYKGTKPVTSWVKYHIKAHGWVEGVDSRRNPLPLGRGGCQYV